ncbi:hypothetical protein DFH07DRAFT_704322, partial [Mycena maculata]
PEKAELRRMIVSERHRWHGIGGHLIRTLIAHAETIPAFQCIELGVTKSQPAAHRIYERLGWKVASI